MSVSNVPSHQVNCVKSELAMFMDRHCCRLCMKKGRVPFVNAPLIPELCKSVKSFFGFEILATDTCSTKVCGECISIITEALSYKNRVLYNQECLKKEELLHTQIKSIKVEDDADDDVMIIEEHADTHHVSSSQVSPAIPIVQRTARKSTTKLPYYVPPPKMPVKLLCPKRLKVVCTSLCEKDVSHVRLSKKTRRTLKLTGKVVTAKINAGRKSSKQPTPDTSTRNSVLGDKLQRIIIEQLGSNSNRGSIAKSSSKQPQTINSTSPSVFSVLPAKGGGTNAQASKPTATVSPNDTNTGKVIWCSPSNYAIQSRKSGRKATMEQNVAFKYLANYIASKAKSDAAAINSKQCTLASTTRVVMSTPTSSITYTPNVVSLTIGSDSSVVNSNLSTSAGTTVFLPPPVQQTNIVGRLFVNNSAPGISAASTPIRSNAPQVGTLDGGANVHYPTIRTTPVKYIMPKVNNSTNSSPKSSRSQQPPPLQPPPLQPSPLQNISNCSTSRLAVDLLDNSNPYHKVKVLSVNELNTRASTSTSLPSQATAAVAPINRSQRLPIRISLTRMRNEMVIKLTDSQGCEILYSDLDESEKSAVRSSLLSKESIRKFGQAFQTCSPDEYTLGLLNILGLSRTSFANASN